VIAWSSAPIKIVFSSPGIFFKVLQTYMMLEISASVFGATWWGPYLLESAKVPSGNWRLLFCWIKPGRVSCMKTLLCCSTENTLTSPVIEEVMIYWSWGMKSQHIKILGDSIWNTKLEHCR
jgi:hypothetical protein